MLFLGFCCRWLRSLCILDLADFDKPSQILCVCFAHFISYDQVVRTVIEKSDVSMGPLGASNTEGAEAPVMLNTKVDEASLLNTATIVLSMPFKFPWLSRYGTVMMTLKFAMHEIEACELFDGTK